MSVRSGAIVIGTIHNLTKRFQLLNANFEVLKLQAVIDTAPQIIPEMTEQQMRKGERSDGEQIFPYLQDNVYAMLKVESGGQAPQGIPDLLHSGNFQAGLRTSVTDKAIVTYSIDTKAEMLELGNGKRKGYGPLIYGANKANLAIYAKENLLPELMEKIKRETVGA